MDSASSPGTLSDHVAGELKRLREERRLPYTELSDRLTQLGRPIPVLGLRRIERGERRVDVDELAALALALGVPPLALCFPLEAADRVEVVPGRVEDAWTAARWFTGEADVMLSSEMQPDAFMAWRRAAAPLEHLREHQQYMSLWGRMRRRFNTDPSVLQWIESEWHTARAAIRSSGFTPPPLPDFLAHIDDEPAP